MLSKFDFRLYLIALSVVSIEYVRIFWIFTVKVEKCMFNISEKSKSLDTTCNNVIIED